MLLALFSQGLHDILGDTLMGWSSCGLVAWKWEMKAGPVNHATLGSSQSFPTGAGLRSVGHEGLRPAGQLPGPHSQVSSAEKILFLLYPLQ